jgi:hypothetical protein
MVQKKTEQESQPIGFATGTGVASGVGSGIVSAAGFSTATGTAYAKIVVEPTTIAAASTSANTLIKQLTTKFSKEMAERAAEIDVTISTVDKST